MTGKPETPETPVYDPVYELAKLVATALSDPMHFGQREGLRASLRVGAGTSVALIETRIRAAVAPPRSVTFDLTDATAFFVLTEALEEFAARQRSQAADEGGHGMREQWAGLADRMRAQAETA